MPDMPFPFSREEVPVTDRDSMGLDDRMKFYEQLEAGRRLLPLVPACARIDGRNFHGFCRGLNRPYDERLSRLMAETCLHLVRETGARVGYTQSDGATRSR